MSVKVMNETQTTPLAEDAGTVGTMISNLGVTIGETKDIIDWGGVIVRKEIRIITQDPSYNIRLFTTEDNPEDAYISIEILGPVTSHMKTTLDEIVSVLRAQEIID